MFTKYLRATILGLSCSLLQPGLEFAAGGSSTGEPSRPQAERSSQESQVIEVPGRVVCLYEAVHDLYGPELLPRHAHVYGLKTKDGTLYTLVPTKLSEALLRDPRLREKDLLVKGSVFPKSHIMEVMRTRSLLHGTVCDLYYYCSVCNIESVSPGPCACCQGPVELMEKPLSEHGGVNKQ